MSTIQSTRSRWIDVLLAILVLIGFLYAGKKAFVDPFNGVDFKYIWTAGQAWAKGTDAYEPSYLSSFAENFGFVGYPWFYPPSWLLLAVPLSMLPVVEAELAWRSINFVLILATMALGLLILRRCRPQHHILAKFLLFAVYVFFLQATSILLSTGQTSIIATLGLMAFAFGVSFQQSTSTIFGVVIMALKPQLAVIPIAGVFSLGIARREIVIGTALTLICSIPALVIGGPEETVLGFLRNIQRYGTFRPNLPMFVTGLEHLINRAISMQISSLGYIFFVTFIAVFIGATFRNQWNASPRAAENRLRFILLLFPILTCFFLPLHNYDTVILWPVALICLCGPFPGRPLILLGLMLAFRPLNIAQFSGLIGWQWDTLAPNLLLSIAYTVLMIGLIRFLGALPRRAGEPGTVACSPQSPPDNSGVDRNEIDGAQGQVAE